MPFLEKLKLINELVDKMSTLNQDLRIREGIDDLEADLARQYLRELYELYGSLDKDRPVDKTANEDHSVQREGPGASAERPEEPGDSADMRFESAAPADPGGEALPASAGAEETVSLADSFRNVSPVDEVNRKTVAGKKFSELIPLNDKFMFIMEFFDNSISRYESAVSELDKLNSKKKALDYMQENAWTPALMESQQDLIERFINIIDLKFPGE
jgi:hypothetical protein